eukprot:18488_1
MSSNQKGGDNCDNTNTHNTPPRPHSYKPHCTTAIHEGYMAHRSHVNQMVPSSSSVSNPTSQHNHRSRYGPLRSKMRPPITLRSTFRPDSNKERRRRAQLRAEAQARLRIQRARRNRNLRIIEAWENVLFSPEDLRLDSSQVTISNHGRLIVISSFTEFDASQPDEIVTSDSMQTREEFATKLLRFVNIVKNERLDQNQNENQNDDQRPNNGQSQ